MSSGGSIDNLSTLSAPGNRRIHSLAWPIAVNGLLLQAVVLIDTLVVAPLGEHALASMGLASSFTGLVIGVLFALFNGTQILLAQGHGADDVEGMRSTFWMGLVIGLFVVTLSVVATLVVGDEFLLLIASEASVAELAHDYLTVFLFALVGMTVSQQMTVTLYAIGQSRATFSSTLVEAPVNIFLSIALVHGLWGFPALGVVGAAVGSAVAACTRALFLYLVLRRSKLAFINQPGRALQQFGQRLKNYFAQALPIAGSLICIMLATNVCLLIYARLGVLGFAAMTLVVTWTRFGAQFVTPWALATGILVGQMLGSGRSGGKGETIDVFISRSWRVLSVASVALAGLYAVAVLMLDHLYPALQAETISMIRQLLPLFLILPLIRTSNALCGHVLRAGGDGSFAFYVNLASQWGFLVPVTAVAVIIGEVSVFWVFFIVVLDELLKAIPLHWRMHSSAWRKRLVSP